MVVVVGVMNMRNIIPIKETERKRKFGFEKGMKKKKKKEKIVNKNYEPQPFVYYIFKKVI